MAERNNFARLSREARRRVMRLLVDGATQDEVRSDPEVSTELARKGLALHSTTFAAVRRCPEYAEFKASLETTECRIAADRWAAEALRDCAGITSIADVTQLELLRQLRELAVAGSGDPGELLKLATAVTRIKAGDADDRVKRLTRKLEDAEREAKAREAELLAEIDELKKRLAGTGKSAGINEETIRTIEERIGML